MTEKSPIRSNSLPTGAHTDAAQDVADPHPEVHRDDDKVQHPGGVSQPAEPDIGANSYAHDGTAPPKPDYKRP